MRVAVTTLARFHHLDLARQLYRADAFAGIFLPFPPFKLRRERLPEDLVHTFPFWAYVQQALRPFNLSPQVYSDIDWRKITYTDRRAARDMPPCDAYVAIATAGLLSGAVVQERGGVWVCDRPCTHARHQNDLLHEEFRHYGRKWRGVDPRMLDRQDIEYAQADAVFVPTRHCADTFVERGVARERVRVAPYGVDLGDFYPEGECAKDAFEVLYVGAMSVRKGIKYLLEGFERFQHPNKRLTLVGGPYPETRDMIAKAVATGRVVATGTLPRAEVRRHMAHAHAFVIASVEEGMALVQAQAMACGTPVIANRATGSEDLFTDGQEGFILEPRDPVAIADRLQRLADEPDLRERMGRAALERVKYLGGWDAYGDTVMGHLSELLAAKRA